MKKQVLTYVKPAKELQAGNLILTNRMTVVEVETTESFGNSHKRPCVEVSIMQGGRKAALIYLADDSVLVLE